MTCGTRYKLHAFIQAVLNTNCCQNSATRLLITRLRISQMSKCLSSRLRETSSLCHKTFSSHYEQDHYNMTHVLACSILSLSSLFLSGIQTLCFLSDLFLIRLSGPNTDLYTLHHHSPGTKDKSLALPSDLLAIQTRSIRGTCNYSPSVSLFLSLLC